MKKIGLIPMTVAGLVLAAGSLTAQDQPAGDAAPQRPSREEFRKQMENLSPEEREAKIREMREKFNQRPPQGADLEKHREELRNLSPEEREARLKELREKHGPRPGGEDFSKLRDELKDLSPEEREARMKEFREKRGQGGFQPGAPQGNPRERLAELREKKAAGTLSEDERKQLDRFEEMAARFQNRSGGERPPRRPDFGPRQ